MSGGHQTETGAPGAPDTAHDSPNPLWLEAQLGVSGPSLLSALLGAALEEAPIALWAADPELRLTACSGRALADLNLEPDRLVGTHLLEHLRPDQADVPLVRAHRRALEGQVASCEVACSGRAYRVVVRPLRDEGGTVAGCVGVAFDVSGTRRIEEATAARERLTALCAEVARALAEGGPAAEVLGRCAVALARLPSAAVVRVYALDPVNQVLELWAAGGEAVGPDSRQQRVAVGRLRIGLVAQAARAMLDNDLQQGPSADDRDWARREGVTSFAGHPLLADGRVVGVLAVFGHEPLPADTADALAAVAGPVAQYVERQRAEQERGALLERSRQAQADAAEAARRAAFLARASLTLDSVNELRSALNQVARLAVPALGDWCLVEVVGEGGISRLTAAADPVRQRALDDLARTSLPGRHPSPPASLVLRTGEPLCLRDCPDAAALLGASTDRETLQVLQSLDACSLLAVPLRARGQAFGVLTLVSATPDRRYHDADLVLAEDFARRCGLALDHLRLVEQARREIAERRWAEEALLASEERLRQASKMEAVGRLAGGVAHDFNNVLTVVLGCAELLQSQLPAGPDWELADEIRQAAERAARLTRQLLTFGRGQSPRPRLVSLSALLGTLGSMLRRLLGEDVRLVTDLDPAVGTVFADPGQLEQVVINLAVNARDAMPAGGTLTVATRSVELTASWSRPDVRPGRYVLLSVADTGCGMTDEVRAHLFEPFFSTKGTGEGTGLGLAIVYGVVRQAGGHIDVRSVPGEGSLFEVYLPLAEAEGTPEPGVAPPGALAGTESVLVAEDDGVIRGLVSRALKAAGYTVLEAADGEEALRVASAHADRLDLLVTDVVMPRLGGRDLATLLLGTRPGLRVLFLSGYPDAILVRRGALAAGSDFLEKPFTPEALARKVREVLDR